MTDPTTPTPPATAKSARETIAEMTDSVKDYLSWACNAPLDRIADQESFGVRVRRIARATLALRALLDAQPGSVERLCEAASGLVEACSIWERTAAVRDERDNLASALAAVRASPEAVGAGACEALGGASKCAKCDALKILPYRRDDLGGYVCLTCVETYLDATIEERSEARRAKDEIAVNLHRTCDERDALKAELAAVRTQLDLVRAPLKPGLLESVDVAAERVVRDRDAARAEVQTLKAELASSQRKHEMWVERADKAEDERDAARADLAAARGEVERIARERDDANMAAVSARGLLRSATPPPASEAPISERTRLVYEGAVRLAAADIAEQIGSPRSAFNDYAAHAAGLLAAAERVAKGEGGKA